MYELSLKREGIQVITLNVDENPGELEPFLKSRKIHSRLSRAPETMWKVSRGHFTIPMNWMVDRFGVLDQKAMDTS